MTILRRKSSNCLWFVLAIAFASVANGFSLQQLASRRMQLCKTKHATTTNVLSAAAVIEDSTAATRYDDQLGPMASALTKIGMMSFITSMCIALPVTLFPLWALYKMKLLSRVKKEQYALKVGQFCSRWLMRLIPFCNVKVTAPPLESSPEPSIWACNHVSALDIFILLANDLKARGKKKRPIKIVYWKQLEDNPVTKLLFTQCGFIPVEMTANAAGESNDYDMKSFKLLLKEAKKAFTEGFDVGILPEGQLNPTPEQGLLPCFSGAFTLAKMSKRPIRFMALQGTHRLWHATQGMNCTGRNMQVRVYDEGRKYKTADEFLATFEAVVGEFGTHGQEVKNLSAWLDGSHWKQLQQQKTEEERAVKQKEEIKTAIGAADETSSND
eukprot:CAMPEP_0178899326 /NCGR_PEP_ID=MMETSP0786-20121207/2832_1 /TAXON_ID=186022 /ORGANISM="Thalassionema frauenfeldii, Strain CCMP 1798" /LENGTH=383 /DNA_ID=CAMNT_0020570159 /DNA_START=67 /DNA_END=1215 /DNA_ORIENTATION=+